jgi:hypothetical protein
LTYWRSPYASLKDLEGKYIVARIVSAGVKDPLFSALTIMLDSPQGQQPIIMLLPVLKRDSNNILGSVLLNSAERYVGGRLRSGRFVLDPGSRSGN